MRNAQNLKFYLKFKEKNSLLYRKIRDILYNLKYDSIIYFDQIESLIKNLLNQYNLIERQIIVRNLIFEMDPALVKYYEIFPPNKILNLNLKKTRSNKNQNYDYFNPEKTTLDVLNQIEKSHGYFKFFK